MHYYYYYIKKKIGNKKQVSVNIINVSSLNDLKIVTSERLDYNV